MTQEELVKANVLGYLPTDHPEWLSWACDYIEADPHRLDAIMYGVMDDFDLGTKIIREIQMRRKNQEAIHRLYVSQACKVFVQKHHEALMRQIHSR